MSRRIKSLRPATQNFRHLPLPSCQKKWGGLPFHDQVADCRSAQSSAPRWHENNAPDSANERRSLISVCVTNRLSAWPASVQATSRWDQSRVRQVLARLRFENTSGRVAGREVMRRRAAASRNDDERGRSIPCSASPSSVLSKSDMQTGLGVLCELARSCQPRGGRIFMSGSARIQIS